MVMEALYTTVDGKKILPKIIKRYKLSKKSKVLDLGCKKGFFLKDLNELIPGIKTFGIENHSYPVRKELEVKAKYLYRNITTYLLKINILILLLLLILFICKI